MAQRSANIIHVVSCMDASLAPYRTCFKNSYNTYKRTTPMIGKMLRSQSYMIALPEIEGDISH